jgi:hypothetical protein
VTTPAKSLIWTPVYSITPRAAKLLMAIEAAKADVEHLVLPPTVETELRRQAQVRSTHYSTRIEGDRLTLAEAEKVIHEAKVDFRGRERDVREVRNYWNALLRVEEWAQARKAVDSLSAWCACFSPIGCAPGGLLSLTRRVGNGPTNYRQFIGNTSASYRQREGEGAHD